jgi:hypothetical protein
MEDEMEIRKTRYKQMSTQELLDLHAAGILGDVAYKILENELRERGVLLPSRPKGEEPPAEVNNPTRKGGKWTTSKDVARTLAIIFSALAAISGILGVYMWWRADSFGGNVFLGTAHYGYVFGGLIFFASTLLTGIAAMIFWVWVLIKMISRKFQIVN